MKQIEWITRAANLLDVIKEDLPETAQRTAKELLQADVDEVPDTQEPAPKMTDARWHEYAVAAIGAFLRSAPPVPDDVTREGFAKTVSEVAVGIADRMLAAAEERAK